MQTYTFTTAGMGPYKELADWLCAHFPLRFIPEEEYMHADFLLCDTFRFHWEKFPGVRILVTAENHAADLNNFDYCLTHEPVEDDRRHRFPYWQYVTLFDAEARAALTAPRAPLTAEELRARQRDFCAFVSYNGKAKKRVNMVQALMKRRRVSCGGPFMNNIGYRVENKREFLAKHLFSVAYENEATTGYQTEKIVDAFIARSIPLYWGSDMAEEEFNPAAFVHARRYPTQEAFLDDVLAIADNEERLLAMLNAYPLRDPLVLDKAEAELLAFFTRIIERGPKAVQRTRAQKVKAFLAHFYGHGLFRTIRRISRRLRGKNQQPGDGTFAFERGIVSK